jgi:hypothetical protein
VYGLKDWNGGEDGARYDIDKEAGGAGLDEVFFYRFRICSVCFPSAVVTRGGGREGTIRKLGL